MDLHEFPVLIEETNEVITLLLTTAEIKKATIDEKFLQSLIEKEKSNHLNEPNNEDTQNYEDLDDHGEEFDKAKNFVWPDDVIFLLIELYREKEEEFSTGKRSKKIWTEISQIIKEKNTLYNVTGLQCSTKMSGLKRTYRNIVDQNKKSGNCRNTWQFFSVMDSIFGTTASIAPPAIATSDGPANPYNPHSSGESSTSLCATVNSPSQPKKKRVEVILQDYIEMVKMEKKEKDLEKKDRERNREKRYQEKKEERQRQHSQNMEIQKSLVDILQALVNKK